LQGRNRGLGDIPTAGLEPNEAINDILRQGVSLPRHKYIVRPDWNPPKILGEEGLQQVIEEHLLPRQYEMMQQFLRQMGEYTQSVKAPNWIEPPVKALGIDQRTEAAVAIPGGAPGAVTTVLTFTVPDRYLGILNAMGEELVIPAQWGNVNWALQVNEKPVYLYNNFRQQTGTFINPTRFPAPVMLKANDVVTLLANQTVAVGVGALARIMGYLWPSYRYTQDGSFAEQKTF
jgi:hypothetical protein